MASTETPPPRSREFSPTKRGLRGRVWNRETFVFTVGLTVWRRKRYFDGRDGVTVTLPHSGIPAHRDTPFPLSDSSGEHRIKAKAGGRKAIAEICAPPHGKPKELARRAECYRYSPVAHAHPRAKKKQKGPTDAPTRRLFWQAPTPPYSRLTYAHEDRDFQISCNYG